MPINITKLEVIEAIQSLKKGKAKDIHDLTAEHVKTAPETVADFQTPVITVEWLIFLCVLFSRFFPNAIKRE